MITSEQLKSIIPPLLEWFAVHQRPLPWRESRDPYSVWVSEIMLQQTRIEAVKRYYLRFMEALPDVTALSRVEEDRLLKLWEGLGYYNRARHLQKAANIIVKDYGGRFPTTYGDWLRLPGVGAYTAGAVASICFGEKVTAVDGNVLRVMARVTGNRSNVLLPETKKEIEAELQAVMPEDAGAFNEALMELGELVCLPNGAPDCQHCPLVRSCIAYRDGLTAELPVRIKQLKRRSENRTVFLLMTSDGRVAIEKRPAKGLLAGMYQFPNTVGFLSEAAIRETLEQQGLWVRSAAFLQDAKHVFTHVDWLMKGWLVRVSSADGPFQWVTPQELADTYALPTAFQPFLKALFRKINEQ